MSKLWMGVIGAGSMGKNHLRVISGIPAFQLTGLYDADAENGKQAADAFGTRAFDDLDTLLKSTDAVSIAAPSSLHCEIAVRAAQAGCHVLVEKPIALNTQDAQRIIDACATAGVTLMVGHIERFNPVFGELIKVLRDERIFTLSFRRLSPFDPRVSDASVVQDLMIHDIDMLCALVQSPLLHVSSQGLRVYSDKPDHVQTHLLFENSMLADLTASRITESKVRRLEVTAQNAYVAADLLNRSIDIMRQTRFLPEQGMSYRQENISEKVYVPMAEPLRAELTHFAECVASGSRPQTDGESAKRALEICERIMEGLKPGGGQ